MLKDEVIEKYLMAGKIAKQTLNFIYNEISSKLYIDVLEVAEKAENYIIRNGGKPAFPCNVGFNAIAAHYTPITKEVIEFREGLLKIDVGVHIDGYIADTAITIARGREYHEISRINKTILDDVISMISPGKKLGELGSFIETRVSKLGYKVIRNLSGHLIDRYNLHAGKNFPNVREFFSQTIKEGEIYAIEPFITFSYGSGEVYGGRIVTIYSLSKIKKLKDKRLDKFKKDILNKFGPLPFTPRWLNNKEDVIDSINQLYKRGVLKGYPVLIESKGAPVSQFEHTVIVTEEGALVTTA